MNEIYVVISDTWGSAPRNVGTAMQVTRDETKGTIGGGALEFKAIERARALLADNVTTVERVPLGPGLGQCCGGAVELSYTREPHALDLPKPMPALPAVDAPRALWLWGAGHVGRAVARLAPKNAFDLTWVDDAVERFPQDAPERIRMAPAADMARLANRAETEADHLIFTYSHEIDLALCAALSRRKVRSIGLIGSNTKWQRFSKRLKSMGVAPDGITCPIGDKSLGKHPDAIAWSTLHQLMIRQEVPA